MGRGFRGTLSVSTLRNIEEFAGTTFKRVFERRVCRYDRIREYRELSMIPGHRDIHVPLCVAIFIVRDSDNL